MGATTGTLSEGHATHDLTAALRALRTGTVDESSRSLAITPTATATLGPLVASLRWGTVLFGLTYVTVMANEGRLQVVWALSVLLFLTTWRSTRPLQLGSPHRPQQVVALTDTLVAGVALGLAHGYGSSLAAAAIVPVGVAAFGWGLPHAAWGSAATIAAAFAITTATGGEGVTTANLVGAGITVGAAGTGLVIRRLCLDAERHRRALHGRIDALADANELLVVLTQVARTLPNAYNLNDAVERVRLQLTDTFHPRRMLLVAPGDRAGTWRAELADGVALPPLIDTEQLPLELHHVEDLRSARLTSTGCLVAPLRARGELAGLLWLDQPTQSPFGERERALLDGLADLLALTLDNARWFGRLRSYGAEAERSRIARELHDRLGQWLTYIGIELERILAHAPAPTGTPEPEREALERLQHDVQLAMTELRETLRDLRTTVTAERPLEAVVGEVMDRFTERTGVPAVVDLRTPGRRVDQEIEHELLRILQEALHNVDKHAKASQVTVRWEVDGAGARLELHDDGRGFDPTVPRDGSYGLVGMRERAAGIGATLEITSAPGSGTTLVVHTSTESAS